MTTEDYVIETIYRRQRLGGALAKMPDKYSRLIIVLYLLGLKQYEIAEVFHVTNQRIQQHLDEFRKRNGLYYSFRTLDRRPDLRRQKQ